MYVAHWDGVAKAVRTRTIISASQGILEVWKAEVRGPESSPGVLESGSLSAAVASGTGGSGLASTGLAAEVANVSSGALAANVRSSLLAAVRQACE